LLSHELPLIKKFLLRVSAYPKIGEFALTHLHKGVILFVGGRVWERILTLHSSGENVSTITKKDFARILAEEMGLKKTRAMQFVAAFFQTMTETIIQGNRIEARGFGVFTVKNTNAKPDARNPKTGEQVFVPKRRMVCFKPGKALRVELSKPVEIEE